MHQFAFPAVKFLKLFRACARFVASEAQEVFHNLKSPPIHPKPRPASRTTHKSVSPLTSPEIIAAARPTTIIESHTPISAQPPQKRLNLGPLKGWGVQHDGVSLSTVEYAQNYQDKFNEEYPEYAKAVLPTDLMNILRLIFLGLFRLPARSYVLIHSRRFPVTRLSVTTYVPAMTPSSFCIQ
ncbi:hypothetical protein DFH08DRAFT_801668 [Mycena albidolilacea]|uniref:Uncharacterized protein n=1 Tax=Mycena albidolilacea TaxID=1033008 RepID=A0AAD7AJ09_9AGAR|nr:hypothetical protein DFH08DRAFT_801668 [Mycena albidolilacea]